MSTTREVELDDITYEVDISYTFSGKYYPATLETPAEYPEFEFEIEEIKLNGMTIHSEQLKERLFTELCKVADAIQEQAGDASASDREEARADYLHDLYRDEPELRPRWSR